MSDFESTGDEPVNPPTAPAKAKRVRKPKDNGQMPETQVLGKSFLKLVDEAKAEAAPTANILGGDPGGPGPDPNDLRAAVVDQTPTLRRPAAIRDRSLPRYGSREKTSSGPSRSSKSSSMREIEGKISMREIEGKIDKNYYFVFPQMSAAMEGESFKMALVLCVNTSGIEFLWPLKERLVDDDNRWTNSAWNAVKIAQDKWIKVRANQKPGAGYYDYFAAKGDLGEPEFSVSDEDGYMTLVNAATSEERKIKTPDHPIMAKVEGRKK
jgi:hypothetical protein